MNLTFAFVIGMAGWAYIIYEIFAGEASKVSASKAPPAVQSAFKTMRIIVTVGWAIYPIGYIFGYFTGSGPEDSMSSLNIIYNLADMVNKIGFGLVIWSVATRMSDEAMKSAKSQA
jgi:bacteriorhodopsin